MKECVNCGFLNEYGYCTCPSMDKWYACPIESEIPENIQALKEYVEWCYHEQDILKENFIYHD